MTTKADVLRTYVEWENDGTQTSVEQLAAHYGMDENDLHKFFHYPPVVSLLADQYNLPPPPRRLSKRALNELQKRWLRFCTNPHTTRNLITMCKEFGIDIETHDRWMQQAVFQREYNKLIARRVGAMKGEFIRRTAQKASAGDLKAVELIYRMNGTPIPSAIAETSSTSVELEAVVRAMQKHLTQEQLAAVAGEMLRPTLAIEAASPEDEDDS